MKYFGTDGIRGVANSVLTPMMAFKIGRYLGSRSSKRIIIGKDSRISGDMLEAALVAGATSAGSDVYTLGVIPTPGVAHLISKYEADFGVVISASHNPVIDNGIKILDEMGRKISSEIEIEIEDFLDNEEDTLPSPTAGKIGRVVYKKESVIDYASIIAKTVDSNLDGVKVVVDCANGGASYTTNHLFSYFKCEVIYINNEPDGLNINEDCGSTNVKSLSESVVEHKADLGIALDGDADRIICIDENGDVVDGDVLIYLLASALKSEHKLRNAKVAVTIMSNTALEKILRDNLNVSVVRTNVGDKHICQAIREEELMLGGESSGHIILKEYSEGGDGLLVGLHVMKHLLESNQKLSSYTKMVKMFPSKLVNVAVGDKNYILNNRLLLDEVNRVNNILEDTGRVLIRASGTENLVRVYIESNDESKIDELIESFVELVKEIDGGE